MPAHMPRSSTTKTRASRTHERGTRGALTTIVDRGLAVVLTMVLGATCFVAEACGADTSHPPVTSDEGTDPAPNVAGSSGTAAEGNANTSTGASNNGGNGTNDTNGNGLLPPDQTSPTNPGAGNGGNGTTTPTQPTLDGG